jgi:hypothetical protein
VNDIRERLGRLADAGAEGIEVTRPALTAPPRAQPRWGPWPIAAAGVAVAGVVVAAVGAVAVLGGDGGDRHADTVAGEGPGASGARSAATVAVVYGSETELGRPTEIIPDAPELRFRFLDAGGAVLAERSWGEAFEGPAGGRPGEAVVRRGLLQGLPAGEIQLEATLPGALGPVSCTQPVTVVDGDRLILISHVGVDAGPAADLPCAVVETVDSWAEGRTGGPLGESYVGLTLAEAEAQAGADGLEVRVVGDSGVDAAVTMDLRCDRLDLTVFDDTVVAAGLPRETTPDQCGPAGS